jgi:homoserine kinase
VTTVSSFAGRHVSVRVPATTANLGPGFDTLGLALAQYDELDVRVRHEPGATVEVIGVGAGSVPLDENNLVVRSIAHTFAYFGQELPGLDVVAHNTIPHARGMGSSGAAIVSGIMAARGLLEGIVTIDSTTLLSLATELEGHPDNVAPALFGGLTIAWVTPHGPAYKKLIAHRGVSPLVFVPQHVMSTELARSLQPRSVPHEDAVFNVSSYFWSLPKTNCIKATVRRLCRKPTDSFRYFVTMVLQRLFPVPGHQSSYSQVILENASLLRNWWKTMLTQHGSH